MAECGYTRVDSTLEDDVSTATAAWGSTLVALAAIMVAIAVGLQSRGVNSTLAFAATVLLALCGVVVLALGSFSTSQSGSLPDEQPTTKSTQAQPPTSTSSEQVSSPPLSTATHSGKPGLTVHVPPDGSAPSPGSEPEQSPVPTFVYNWIAFPALICIEAYILGWLLEGMYNLRRELLRDALWGLGTTAAAPCFLLLLLYLVLNANGSSVSVFPPSSANAIILYLLLGCAGFDLIYRQSP